jgi:hypothetical protein
MESNSNVTRLASPPQQTVVPAFPAWKIKQLLFTKCQGARFVGVQQGLNPDAALVLFNPPGKGRQTTLSVPLFLFSYNPLLAVVLVQHKITMNQLNSELFDSFRKE